ncbi:MAG TPA: glycosyltransferase family 1 protein [Methylocella sp.]|nr:glycosyltransferase family 1 protein [Methylocella sp.]
MTEVLFEEPQDCQGSSFHLKKPRLTINGRVFTQKVTGVQRYAREIIAALDRLLEERQEDYALDARVLMPPSAANGLGLHNIRTEVTKGKLKDQIWTQCLLPVLSRGVLLSLGNNGPVFGRNHIVCIHDLNTFLVPESYNLAFRGTYRILLPLLAKCAARVVTVSAFSARMLNKFGLLPLEKITVIPNGHEHVLAWKPKNSIYAKPPERPYIFALGSQARHKNISILLAIAQELDELGFDLLIAGSASGNFTPFEIKVARNVHVLGSVADDDLAALFQNAFCFAFPSLTEGFGLPALEAMVLGCPVITTSYASLPEVCGRAALYADPKSPASWLERVRHLRDDEGLAAELRARGPRQAARFSWTTSAQLYLDLIIPMIRDSEKCL